jgi:hypothetical protein
VVKHLKHWHEVTKTFFKFQIIDNTGQQNLTFFLSHERQEVHLAVLFMLISDMYTEFFYQAGF